MNQLNRQDEFREERLEELIGQCDWTLPAPDEAFVGRLRAEVLGQVQEAPATSPIRRTTRRLFVRYLIAGGVAAAVLCAFWLRTPSSWAQVQEALNSRPWIHMRAKLDDGETHENWLSIPQQKIAFRVGPTARYLDVRNDLQFDYEESRGTVIRAPHRPIQSPESMFAIFQQLLQGKQPNVAEVEHAKVLDTRSRTVIENGKEWLDVELTLQHDANDPAVKALARLEFRVDPATKLPQTMTLNVLDPGRNSPADAQRRLVYEIDYPAEGPADIYALGIPRDAKLDDRVPSDDTARALKAITAGRRDFDSYFAIVFHVGGSADKPFSGFPTGVVWRSGNRVRAEICSPREPVPPYAERPAGMDDLTWWKQQLKHFRFLPTVVCDGKTGYSSDFGPPDAKGNQRVTSWKRLATIRKGESLSEFHISPARGNFPEFFAYPLVEPSDTTTVTLEPAETAELPHGSLLTFAVTGSAGPGTYLRSRYWLDGDRGYVTTRLNLDQLQYSREEAIELDVCVEDEYSMRNLQRSPKGFWYPTLVVRQTAKEPKELGEKRVLIPATSTAFLLDFPTDIPDSHFTTKDRRSGF
jgi:hypothetical protein